MILPAEAAAVLLPFARRPGALPVLIDLYRAEQDNRRHGRRHRTPAQLVCRLAAVLPRWFPGRRFVLVAGAGLGSHEVARFRAARGGRLTLVSKLHPDADLFERPPPRRGKGRPRVKGTALPKPRVAAARARLRRSVVRWYGGGTRRVALAGGVGHWDKSGHGLAGLRWVFVRDREGTHRDEFFYSTDPAMGEAAVGRYAWRWNIETTFQECRSGLGLETTRGWCRRTVRCRPMPVRTVLRGGLAVRRAAGVGAGPWRGLARQGLRQLLRRAGLRAPPAVDGLGFPTGRR